MNLSAAVGERDIFIPCHTGRHDFYPLIWEINGIVYESSNLPDTFQLGTGGLFVNEIKQHMNNTSFRCYYPKQENTVILQRSSVGFLTVRSRSEKYNTLERTCRASNRGVPEQQLYLDHQLLLFENETKTFAWKNIQGLGCYKYEVISKQQCDDARTNPVIGSWSLHSNQTSITVSASEMFVNGSKSPMYFNITGRSHEGRICQQTEEIQVNESSNKTIIMYVTLNN